MNNQKKARIGASGKTHIDNPRILNNYLFKSLLLFAFSGLVCIVSLFIIPADVERVFFFGLSRNRLVISVFLLVASIFAILGAFKWRGQQHNITAFYRSASLLKKIFLMAAAILFVMAILFLVSPNYRFRGVPYLLVLTPLVVWGAVALALCLLPAVVIRWGDHSPRHYQGEDNSLSLFKAASRMWLVLLVFPILVLLFRLGLRPDYRYWNENGIPLLLTQIGFSVLIAIAALGAIHQVRKYHPGGGKRKPWIEILLFITIWLAAALVWSYTPAVRTHFSPGPHPPNFVFYPVSDALTYDILAQRLLNGHGFAGGGHVGKPMLIAMTAFFHLLAGGDYTRFYWVQVAFYALIPAALYLIGKKLHGRAVGILAALFVLFLERNTYQGILYLSSSHSKLIMSEVPAAMFVAIAVYFLIRGLGSKAGTIKLAALGVSAGVIGLSTLVRENAIILVPLPFILILFRQGLNWRKKINAILLMAVFLLAAVSPWALRTYQVRGTPFYFAPKIQSVILNNRLLPLMDEETSWQNASPSISLKKVESPKIPSGMAIAWLGSEIGSEPQIDQTNTENLQAPSPDPLGLVEAVVQHFFHNLVTSFAILPVSPQLEDLTHAAQDRVNVFPGMKEGSALQPMTVLAILVNLFFLAVGISAAWQKKGLAGVVPLAAFLLYMLGLAAARSSGGRYIVTINWALLLYYAIGLGCCVLWLAARLGFNFADGELIARQNLPKPGKMTAETTNPLVNIAAGFLAVFAIGLMIPLTEKIFPRRYPNETDPLAVQTLYDQGVVSADTFADYQKLTTGGDLKVRHGRLLYPRFYLAGEEVSRKSGNGFRKMDFPRLHFMLQGGSSSHVILPLGEPPGPVPDSADTIVVGCEGKVFFAKLALIFDRDSGQYAPLWWDETQPDPCIAVP